MRPLVLLALVACAPVPAGSPGGSPEASPVPIADRYSRARIRLLDAVNRDRAGRGVRPVALDSLATVVAQAHADAMAAEGYLSHYQRDGSTPYLRYAEAGGTGHVLENVYRWRSSAGTDSGVWVSFDVAEAQSSLIASPGHRATILDPARTHLGVGIAVDDVRGAVYVVQEFVARHATLEVPRRGWRRASTVVTGRMLGARGRPLAVTLSREPGPPGWSLDRQRPPGGSYPDGRGGGIVVPPWAIRWNPSDRSFEVEIGSDSSVASGRWYAVVHVAPESRVREAIGQRRVSTSAGWPGAAFVLDVL